MADKKRIDQILVDLKLAPSRAKAHELIASGEVEVKIKTEWQPISTPGRMFLNLKNDEVRLRDDRLLRYVSRGGLKLEGALNKIGLSVKALKILDLGQSTGGFTDCLLQAGAEKVIGIDVGQGQLHPKLVQDPRVIAYEGIHVREAAQHAELSTWRGQFALVVADLSFISLTQALEPAKQFLCPGGKLLALVKPQFELGAAALNKRGVVKDRALHEKVRTNVFEKAQALGYKVIDYFPSQIKGQDGNQEFFIYAQLTSH